MPLALVALGLGIGGAQLVTSLIQSYGADQAQKKAQDILDSVDAPTLKAIQSGDIPLEKVLGTYAPELIKGNAYSDITENPAVTGSQLDALNKISNVANEGGNDAQFRALNNISLNNALQKEKSSRDAILANARARGTSGSGGELAAQLQNNQGSADMLANAGFTNSSNAAQRALDAIQSQYRMSSGIRQQDLDKQEKKAQAENAIREFNASNMNRAAEFGKQKEYDVQSGNVGKQYDVMKYNQNIPQMNYQNQLELAKAKSGAATGYGNYQAGQSANNMNNAGNTLMATGSYARGLQPQTTTQTTYQPTMGDNNMDLLKYDIKRSWY